MLRSAVHCDLAYICIVHPRNKALHLISGVVRGNESVSLSVAEEKPERRRTKAGGHVLTVEESYICEITVMSRYRISRVTSGVSHYCHVTLYKTNELWSMNTKKTLLQTNTAPHAELHCHSYMSLFIRLWWMTHFSFFLHLKSVGMISL